MDIILLQPVFKQMIWGGDRLRKDFGYDIPGDKTGECWAIAAHPNGDCTVINTEYAGKTLSWLWENHRELFGGFPGDRFPLLVKIIDAKADLSIQVHPDDAYAAEHENGSLGKMECWYILDAKAGGTIVIGHHAKSREEVASMIENRQWKDFIREVPVKKGDFFQINPGCVHAIKAGTLILETQQNSDITYRVYDYDRLDNGKPRQLHVRQSIDVIEAPFTPAADAQEVTQIPGATLTRLVSCPRYTVVKAEIAGTAQISWDQPFVNISVLEGEGTLDGMPVRKGTHAIIPSGYGKMELEGQMTVIWSYPQE